jgi:hypothetical protein
MSSTYCGSTSGSGAVVRRAGAGTVVYVATIGRAFINPLVCLLVFAALAIFFVFDVGGSARS